MLLIAAEHHNIDMIRLLLCNGAFLKFNDFYTLEQVITSNANDTLDLIKSLTSDITSPILFVLKNKAGFSLLDLAKIAGRQDML